MTPHEPVLTPEELEALSVQAAPAPPKLDEEGLPLGGGAGPTIAAYDLTSQDRPVRGHLPTLDLIHAALADGFGSSLKHALRTDVRVTTEDTQLTKLRACLSYIAEPSCIGVLELQPLSEPALLVIDPALVLALMTRFYGASDGVAGDAAPLGDRPLTPLERGFAGYICGRFGEAMQASWAHVAPMSAAVRSIELSPRFASIVPAGDTVVTSVFKVSAGPLTGEIQFIVPYASLRPHHRALQSSVRHGDSQRVRSWQEQLTDHLRQVEVQVTAEFGDTRLTLSQVAHLGPGTVLRLSSDRETPLVIQVEGGPKMLGRLALDNGHLAIRVVGWLNNQDDAQPGESEEEEAAA